MESGHRRSGEYKLMRYTGPKNRVSRREGVDLGLKTPGSKGHARLLRKLNIKPGQHGSRSRRKTSERGKQLREKQKMRYLFGLTENQLKNYFKKAVGMKGNTALFLGQFLEKRLDNTVYRLGFAPTRAAARQLVHHGHIKVNDKNVDVPSYQVKAGDVISFVNEKSIKIPYVEAVLSNKNIIIPQWLERKGAIGKFVKEPVIEEIEKQIDMRNVIEYYSR